MTPVFQHGVSHVVDNFRKKENELVTFHQWDTFWTNAETTYSNCYKVGDNKFDNTCSASRARPVM